MTNSFNAKSTADQVLAGVDLKGMRVLVTGEASGIGRETARALAAHGASVVGAVRDLATAESATTQVRDAASQGGGSLELIELDLASLQSVRAAADKLLADGRRFNVIIANAGVMATPAGKTADGFETQFAVMPGNSLTDLPRHFSEEELQGLFATVGNARAEAGLPPAELKDISQAAATSVWAAVVADPDQIGGKYLEDVAVAMVNDTPNPFADGVRLYALDADKAKQLWAKSEELVGAA